MFAMGCIHRLSEALARSCGFFLWLALGNYNFACAAARRHFDPLYVRIGVNRVVLPLSQTLPVYARFRTSRCTALSEAMGQQRLLPQSHAE
jgi:hypothetical protein